MPDEHPQDPLTVLPELMQRLLPVFRRLFISQGIPPWDADDVVQDALAATLRRWSTLHDKEAWLYGTVRRMCRVYWRERRSSRVVALEPSWFSEPRRAVAAREERRDMELDLCRHCAKLPSQQGRLVYLRYGLGMSMRQTAGAMGICYSTVFRHERQVLKRLRRLLASGKDTAGARLRPDARGSVRSRSS